MIWYDLNYIASKCHKRVKHFYQIFSAFDFCAHQLIDWSPPNHNEIQETIIWSRRKCIFADWMPFLKPSHWRKSTENKDPYRLHTFLGYSLVCFTGQMPGLTHSIWAIIVRDLLIDLCWLGVLQERDTLLMQFQDLKGQMSRLHNTEHQRLVKLTMLCDTALKDLRAKRAKVQYSTL